MHVHDAKILLVVGAIVAAQNAAAGVCGDNIDGMRVACACGDVVVSTTRLQVGDPVTTGRCELDGLIVRAAPTAETITLDLGGLTIVGSGAGHGLLVERGGSDGAVIIGGPAGKQAEIVGFSVGVNVPNPQAIRRIERIHAKGNRYDGVRVRQAGAFLVDVTATDNGRDGIKLIGSGGRLVRVRAEGNGGSGIYVLGKNVIIEGASIGNGRNGIVSHGQANDLTRAVARDNGRAGIITRAGRQYVEGAASRGNARSQLLVDGRQMETAQ